MNKDSCIIKVNGDKLQDPKDFLKSNIEKDFYKYYGIKDEIYINNIVENWFDETKNYDGRWKSISEAIPKTGKIFDMAAGCGTFVLHGLRNGFDVWGLEPEPWKREYYKAKIRAIGAPLSFQERIVAGVGESLPYRDKAFDLVTSWQTVEHVTDLGECVREMLRVLKPGGTLHIRAPDYRGFYEPHYRVPFLPGMGKSVAAVYLKLIGRPTLGLQTIHFITEKDVLRAIDRAGYAVAVEGSGRSRSLRRQEKILARLPGGFPDRPVRGLVDGLYAIHHIFRALKRFGREEPVISLCVTKISGERNDGAMPRWAFEQAP